LLLVELSVVLGEAAHFTSPADGLGIGLPTSTRNLGMRLFIARIEVGQPIYWTGAGARPTLRVARQHPPASALQPGCIAPGEIEGVLPASDAGRADATARSAKPIDRARAEVGCREARDGASFGFDPATP
jgi:hypothetical protein